LRPLTEVKIGSLVLKNPVMTASGTFGYGEEYSPYVDLNRLGAVVVKGISLEPRKGNPPPRIMETPGGMLNAIGLQNVGAMAFVTEKLPWLRQFDTKVIVNIFGETLGEYGEVAAALTGVPGIHALEVNISCPNVQKLGHVFGCDPGMSGEVTRAVRGGASLADALEDHDALTATGYNLIRVGERSGKLASMLDSLARLYEEAGRNRMKRVLILLEPIAILVIGSMIGTIILGVILAITSANDLAV